MYQARTNLLLSISNVGMSPDRALPAKKKRKRVFGIGYHAKKSGGSLALENMYAQHTLTFDDDHTIWVIAE